MAHPPPGTLWPVPYIEVSAQESLCKAVKRMEIWNLCEALIHRVMDLN